MALHVYDYKNWKQVRVRVLLGVKRIIYLRLFSMGKMTIAIDLLFKSRNDHMSNVSRNSFVCFGIFEVAYKCHPFDLNIDKSWRNL